MLELTCANCGRPLREGASFCPECGVAVCPASNAIFCSECGHPLNAGESACPNCGAPVSDAAMPVEAMPAPTAAGLPESGALAVCAMVFSILFPPIGLILAVIGSKKYIIPMNRKLCFAALIISVITCIVYTIILIKVVPEIISTYRTAHEATDKYQRIKEWLPFL